MNQPTPFGILLKGLREEAGMSQAELADALGKTPQYISNIENGKNNAPPDDTSIVKLSKKLELDGDTAEKLRLFAYADRGMLPPEIFDYIFERPSLLSLIGRAATGNISESFWEKINFNNERAKE